MRKTVVSGFLGILLALGLCGCEAFLSPLQEDRGPQVLQPALDPSEDAAYANTTVRLYFRLAGEGLLAYEDRPIEVMANERIEVTVLRELIAGPRGENTELKPLLNQKTRVLSVTDQNGLLIVTFNEELMETAEPMPANWQEEHPALREEFYLQRRLAVYSVVNTLASLGKFDRVQLCLGTQGSEATRLIRRGSMGFVNENAEQYLDAMNYEGSVVLTPQHMMETLFQALIQNDWARVYRFLSADDETGPRPLLQDVRAELRSVLLRLDRYSVHDESVSSDGKSAIVLVDISLQRPSGETVTRANVPVRLSREGAVLRIDYSMLLRLLGVEAS